MIRARVKFTESSKAVTAEALVESDELSEEEVLERAKALFDKANGYSVQQSMRKVR
jgi:hypothetical protein